MVSVGALVCQTYWSQALLWIKADGGGRAWGQAAGLGASAYPSLGLTSHKSPDSGDLDWRSSVLTGREVILEATT